MSQPEAEGGDGGGASQRSGQLLPRLATGFSLPGHAETTEFWHVAAITGRPNRGHG